MDPGWVCSDCRSLNTARQKRCYRCRLPRSNAELSAATQGMSMAAASASVTVLAPAARLGARYRRTWPLAMLVIPLIIIATALDVAQTAPFSGMVIAAGQRVDDAVRDEQM